MASETLNWLKTQTGRGCVHSVLRGSSKRPSRSGRCGSRGGKQATAIVRRLPPRVKSLVLRSRMNICRINSALAAVCHKNTLCFHVTPRSHLPRWRLVHRMRLFWSNLTEDIECHFFASSANVIQWLCLKSLVNPAWFIGDGGGGGGGGRESASTLVSMLSSFASYQASKCQLGLNPHAPRFSGLSRSEGTVLRKEKWRWLKPDSMPSL